MRTKEHKVYASPADWVKDQMKPFMKEYVNTELEATAAESAGNRDEARLLRQRAAIIRRHIDRLEGLA